MDTNKKDIIKRAIAVSSLIILIIIVGFIMIKYEIEGETKMPFNLSKIMVISTADGISEDDATMKINQCNDLYLTIEKNENSNQQSMIKNVSIENIKVMAKPVKGVVKFYRPNNSGGLAYTYSEESLIEDSITYVGSSKTDMQNLTISNQGGTISFRSCVQGIGEIEVNEESKEVSRYSDGTLLKQAGISISDIRYNLGFDIIIELADGKMYKGYVNTSLPVQDVENSGVQGVEKIDVSDVIFKRIKIR